MQLKVLSWNIWEGKYLKVVIDFLKKQNADIISLQEVVQEVGGKNNNAQIIASDLGYEFVYASALQIEKGRRILDRGNAILVKYKIADSKTHVLSENERRIALEETIAINGSNIHIFNTHLLHTHQQQSDTQNMQAQNLVKILSKEKTVLMGDFNATPESSVIENLDKVLVNTDSTSSPTWSVYPQGCPVCKPTTINTRLDYIFVSSDIKIKSSKVESSHGSDHLPISAIIEI